MLFSQSNVLPEREAHHEEEPKLRKRVKYLKKSKDAWWARWTREYLRGLRERHTLAHKETPCGVQKGDVCILIKNESKDRNKWKQGIVEELITGRDGIVRAVKLRAGNNLERAVQQLYPLELSCNRP